MSRSSSFESAAPLERFSRSADALGWRVIPWLAVIAVIMVVARAMSDTISLATPLVPYLLIAIGLIAAPFLLLLVFPPLLIDITRFAGSRVWAISSVSFAEAVRKRVLWVTPLAIVGVVAVSQFQRALDPEDAIRQVIKACIFATGLVVVITTIILTCTNLPKEIENRVIFTIVTKPTTRLEILLGKIIGFARVSGVILLIMGVFSLAFLKVKEWQLLRAVNVRLTSGQADAADRAVLEHYQSAGLLGTRSMASPDGVEMLATPPVKGQPRRIAGGESQTFLVPFDLTDAQKSTITSTVNAGGGVLIAVDLPYEQHVPSADEMKEAQEAHLPTPESRRVNIQGPLLPTTQPAQDSYPIPQFSLAIFDKDMRRIVQPEHFNGGQPVDLPKEGLRGSVLLPVGGEDINAVLDARRFNVQVNVPTPSVQYLESDPPAAVVVVDANAHSVLTLKPSGPAEVRSNFGRFGMQLRGRAGGAGSVAVFHFSGTRNSKTAGDTATLEVRVGIEGSSRDFSTEDDAIAQMSVQVRNNQTGVSSEPAMIVPEHLRANYCTVPASLVSDGSFDVLVRGLTHDQWFGIQPQTVTLIVADRSFSLNLVKSFCILWMLSILVVAIALFCSTFLSWPVAIVLTLLLLLGHWGVMQVGDAGGSGLGSEVTQSLGLQNPMSAKIVRESVNALSSALNFVAIFLPDISRFSATDDIDRGISIPPARLGDAAMVLFGYGIPLIVLTYAVFRRKEVAP